MLSSSVCKSKCLFTFTDFQTIHNGESRQIHKNIFKYVNKTVIEEVCKVIDFFAFQIFHFQSNFTYFSL